MHIDAIVFDWGGVLAGNVSSGFADLEERLGVPSGAMPNLLGFQPCPTDETNLWHLRELGRATAAEWAQWYCDRVSAAGGLAIPPDLIVASESERFALVDPNNVMLDAARRWKAAGYRLGVCTNNFVEIGSVWRGRLPMELFDAVIVSCEVGLRKPDPEMFAHVAESLGVTAAATVLLDDLPGNIEGARAAGWHAVLVDSDHSAAVAEVDALLASIAP